MRKCRFCGGRDGDEHLFWECTFLPTLQVRELPEFMPLVARDRRNWPRCLLWQGWLPGLCSAGERDPWTASLGQLADRSHMDGMTRTTTLGQCRVRHYECGQTRENVTCEGVLSSMLKQISCASCRSATPCRDRSAGCPRTFFTSSVSNSGLITVVQVISVIVNQSCHAFAGGKPRDPVGSWHLRELDSRYVRLTTSSRHPPQEIRRMVFGLSCNLPFSFWQLWNCRVSSVSMLSLSSERGSERIHFQPGKYSNDGVETIFLIFLLIFFKEHLGFYLF